MSICFRQKTKFFPLHFSPTSTSTRLNFKVNLKYGMVKHLGKVGHVGHALCLCALRADTFFCYLLNEHWSNRSETWYVDSWTYNLSLDPWGTRAKRRHRFRDIWGQRTGTIGQIFKDTFSNRFLYRMNDLCEWFLKNMTFWQMASFWPWNDHFKVNFGGNLNSLFFVRSAQFSWLDGGKMCCCYCPAISMGLLCVSNFNLATCGKNGVFRFSAKLGFLLQSLALKRSYVSC